MWLSPPYPSPGKACPDKEQGEALISEERHKTSSGFISAANMAVELQGRHSSLGQCTFACFLLTDETICIFSFFQSKCRLNFIMNYRCFESANSFQKNILSNNISLCLLLCRKSHANFLCLILHTYSFFCFQLG